MGGTARLLSFAASPIASVGTAPPAVRAAMTRADMRWLPLRHPLVVGGSAAVTRCQRFSTDLNGGGKISRGTLHTFGRMSALLRELSCAVGCEDKLAIVERLKAGRVLGKRGAMLSVLHSLLVGKDPLLAEASGLLRLMNDPGAGHYNALIRACVDASELGKAVDLFAEMKAAGISPDESTHRSLVRAYGSAGKLVEASHHFYEITATGIKPAYHSYVAIVAAYRVAGKLSEVHLVAPIDDGESRQIARERRRKLKKLTFSTFRDDILSAVDEAVAGGLLGHHGSTQELLRAMVAKEPPLLEEAAQLRQAYDATPRTIPALLQKLCSADDPDEAVNSLDALTAEGILDDPKRISQMLRYLVEMEPPLLPEASELVRHVRSPQDAHYATLLGAYGKAGDIVQAVGYFGQMEAARGTEDADELDKAVGIFEAMKSNDELPSPTLATYTALISAHGSAGQTDKAVGYFDEAKAAGIVPDHPSYTALVSAYRVAGKLGEVVAVIDAIRTSEDSIMRLKKEMYKLRSSTDRGEALDAIDGLVAAGVHKHSKALAAVLMLLDTKMLPIRAKEAAALRTALAAVFLA